MKNFIFTHHKNSWTNLKLKLADISRKTSAISLSHIQPRSNFKRQLVPNPRKKIFIYIAFESHRSAVISLSDSLERLYLFIKRRSDRDRE